MNPKFHCRTQNSSICRLSSGSWPPFKYYYGTEYWTKAYFVKGYLIYFFILFPIINNIIHSSVLFFLFLNRLQHFSFSYQLQNSYMVLLLFSLHLVSSTQNCALALYSLSTSPHRILTLYSSHIHPSVQPYNFSTSNAHSVHTSTSRS
jgi:hypothetical protein